MKRFTTLTSNTLLAYGCTLLTFAGGVALSLSNHNWSWFARSGCLVVVIGIVLTSHEIFEHMRRLRRNRASWERQFQGSKRYASQFHRDWAGDEGMHALIKARSHEEETWEIEGHGLFLLICGTLVWGFGDLIGG